MSFATKAMLAGLVLAGAGEANAAVNWDWRFHDLGPVTQTETVYVRATLFNEASSTEVLDMSTMFIGTSVDSPLLNDQFNGAYPGLGFGHGETAPFSAFNSFLSAQTLDPGESISFDFIWFAPQLPAGAPAGTYTTWGQISLCVDGKFTCAVQQYKTHEFSWAVTTVPEASMPTMLLAGLLLLGVAVPRKSSGRPASTQPFKRLARRGSYRNFIQA